MKTTVLEKIDQTLIDSLKKELSSATWDAHSHGKIYQEQGALRDGKSCWIYHTDEDLNLISEQIDRFPVTMSIVNRFLGDDRMGRIYWHQLMPGDRIRRHTDVNLRFADVLKHRYQVYLDIPSGAELELDGANQNPNDFQNSIVDFCLFLPHSYINNSPLPMTFLVFDALAWQRPAN